MSIISLFKCSYQWVCLLKPAVYFHKFMWGISIFNKSKKIGTIEADISKYLVAMGFSRLLRLVFWVMNYFAGEKFVYLILADVIHTVIIADVMFIWVRERKQGAILIWNKIISIIYSIILIWMPNWKATKIGCNYTKQRLRFHWMKTAIVFKLKCHHALFLLFCCTLSIKIINKFYFLNKWLFVIPKFFFLFIKSFTNLSHFY